MRKEQKMKISENSVPPPKQSIDDTISSGEVTTNISETSSPSLQEMSGEAALLWNRLESIKRELEREQNKTKLIVDAIQQTVTSLPKVAPFAPVRSPDNEDVHVVMADISDVHLGERVDPRLTGGLTQYNFDLFKSRFAQYRKGFHRLVGIQRRAYPIDELYINFLGDIVTGESIFEGQPFHIDLPLLSQIFEGGQYFANLIRDFARHFKKIRVSCVAGNHGRGGDRGKSHPLTNWDIALYELMRILLKDQPNVEFEIAETSFLVYHIPGHEAFRHVLIHGQQTQSWMGIPFYGVERAGAKLSSMFGLTLEYVHLGHHHNQADWAMNRVEFLMNGSWVGGSDFSINKLQRVSRPTQNLFFCHPRRGIVLSPKIQLDDWGRLVPDETGVYRPRVSK